MLIVTLLFIQLVIFGGLALLLRYVLTRHINSASGHLEELTHECSKKLDEAKEKREQAEKHYSEMLLKAKEDGEKLKEQLAKEGQVEKDQIIREGREQSEDVMQRAKNAAEAITKELDQKVSFEALEKSREIIRGLLQGKIGEEAHSYWVQELLSQGFDGLSRLHVPADVGEAELVSAYPLKPNETKIFKQRLSEKLGREIGLKEKVEPTLILGLRLEIGNIIIDGSLQSKIQDLTRHVTSASS